MKKILPLIALLFAVALSGCQNKVTYVTPLGKTIETTSEGAYYMAQRDVAISGNDSFNKSILESKSDFQIYALSINKIVAQQPLMKPPTSFSDDLKDWARILLPYFVPNGGVLNTSHKNLTSYVYNIRGDNNNMSGIGNTAIGGAGGGTGGAGEKGGGAGSGGSVTQDLTVNASPYYYRDSRSYTQAKTTGSNITDDKSTHPVAAVE